MNKEELHEAIAPSRKNTLFEKVNTKVLLAVAVLIIAGAPGTYFFLQYQKTQQLLNNPTAASKEEIKGLLDKIGKLMVLPSDENPTVATVSDKSKLSGQAFFAKAENGDKVVIYPSLSRAILYRPSLDRIIDVTSVNVNGPDVAGAATSQGEENTSVSPSAAPTQPEVSVAIFNATKVSGLAQKAQASLSAKLQGYTVTIKGNAKGEYAKTLVVDLSGTKKEQAAQAAKLFNATVGSLPKNEEKPAADILIILGDNAPTLL